MYLVDDYARGNDPSGIGAAIRQVCLDDGGRDGQIERLSQAIDNTAKVISRIVERLHASGRLDDADVVEILGGQFSIWKER